MIKQFYDVQHQEILRHLQRIGQINICMNGQFDSPGYCAAHCTVSALESTTKKIIGFATVLKSEVNNKSAAAESLGFKRLLNYFKEQSVVIGSVTTDNSTSNCFEKNFLIFYIF